MNSIWPRSRPNMNRPSLDTMQQAGSFTTDRHNLWDSTASWTSTGSEAEETLTSNTTELPRQSLLLQEYNRVAEKRGLRPILYSADEGDGDDLAEGDSHVGDRRNWFARTFGKPVPVSRRCSRHKRSDSDPSDPAQSRSYSSKPDAVDTLKSQSLQTLVRISGKSFLYLPCEYATRSLMLPTCFRAAAQYLVLHGPKTRGIFRVSGSMRVVNELYNYYCISLGDDADIATTVRSPNLPFHIKAGAHDVASMFKRLLAGLPGGILGHLQLFGALVDIQKMDGHASNEVLESGKSGLAHIKAHLIALTIGSVPGHLRRELICCVFGLLSLIGHAAETQVTTQVTPGSSLPHSELMGYAALGIIFGPLLMGNLLDSYSCGRMSSEASVPASPSSGPFFHSTPSPQSKTDKRRKSMASEKHALPALPSALDKILLANDVAEMLITNWRTIVNEMKHMGIMKKDSMPQHPHQDRSAQPPSRSLRPSKSETFTDNDMSAMVNQSSQLYNSKLRRTRSASNTHNPDDAMSSDQPSLVKPSLSQRSSDLSFGEFTARKNLKKLASNISIGSDSSHSAFQPQRVKAITPPLEDPFYISGSIAIPARSGAAKLIKQRRVSGALSSIFSGDKLSTKEQPKRARESLASRSHTEPVEFGNTENTAQTSKDRREPKHQVNAGLNSFENLPTKKTPPRVQYQDNLFRACKSEPTVRPCKGDTASKTAALIAKIMNSKPLTDTSPTRLVDKTLNESNKAQLFLENTAQTAKPQLFSGSPSRNDDNWMRRRNAAKAAFLENAVADLPTIISPTPQRPWKVRNSPLVTGKSMGPSLRDKSPPITLASTTTVKLEESLLSRSYKKRNTQVVSEKETHTGSPKAKLAKDRLSAPKGEEKSTKSHSREQRHDDQLLNDTVLPLSEVKNAAWGPIKDNSINSPVSIRKQTDGINSMEARFPAVQSSVKAMAAMFDTAAWKTTFDPICLDSTAQSNTTLLKPKEGFGLSQNMCRQSMSRSGQVDLHTPRKSPSKPVKSTIGNIETCETHLALMHRTPSGRLRHRLTKSEGKLGHLSKAGRISARERREAARSGDWTEASDDLVCHYPLSRQLHGRSAENPQKQAAENVHSLVRALDHAEKCPSDENFMSTSPPRRFSSIEELRRQLGSRTAECEHWKSRAELAEKRLDELKLALAEGSRRSSDLCSVSEEKGKSDVLKTEEVKSRASARQSQLRATASNLTQEMLGISSSPKNPAGSGLVSPDRTVSNLRKGFATDGNSSGRYEPNPAGAVRGKLMNTQLTPFSM